MLGRKMPPLVSHTVWIFLYFTRVFNDKWVRGGTVSLSLKRSIVPICLVDYLHHSALKHLWQFRLTDFLNPLLLLTHSLRPPLLSRLSPSSIFVLCLCPCVSGWVPTGKTARLKLSQTSSAMIIPDSSVQPRTHSHFSSSWAALSPPFPLMWGEGQRLRRLLPVNLSTSSSRTDC